MAPESHPFRRVGGRMLIAASIFIFSFGVDMDKLSKQAAIDALNAIMELELAGVVHYTHYSLMVYGFNRIPIVSWLKGNAEEGLAHAHKAGEMVTLLGGHPSLKIGALLETAKHDVADILRESLEHEKIALAAYYHLLTISEGKSILLEEYARSMIVQEELHLDEVNKMLRRPGSIAPFSL
jgi:bacterioferritin